MCFAASEGDPSPLLRPCTGMLPSAAHPSYPYGNPYAPSSSRSAHWHSSNPLPSSSSKPQYRAGFPLPPQSVAGRGGLGGPRGSGWNDLALSQLLPGSRRDGGGHGREADDEEIGEGGPTGQEQQQDAPPAPGQIPDGTNGATANGEEGLQDDTGIVGVDDGGGGEEAMEEEEDDQLEPDDG